MFIASLITNQIASLKKKGVTAAYAGDEDVVIIDINGEITSTIDLPCSFLKISNTLGRTAKHRDLPNPVGRDTNTIVANF